MAAGNLLDAILDKFRRDPELTQAFPGGIHQGKAIEASPLPYVVIPDADEVPEWNYKPGFEENTTLTMRVYAKGEDINAKVNLVKDRFDWNRAKNCFNVIPFDLAEGYIVRGLERKRVKIVPTNRVADGAPVNRGDITYLAYMQDERRAIP